MADISRDLKNEGAVGTAEKLGSARVVNAAFVVFWASLFTIFGWILPFLYLNFHFIMSKFHVRTFREMSLLQKLGLAVMDLAAFVMVILIIAVPLVVFDYICNDTSVGAVALRLGMTVSTYGSGFCDVFSGAAAAVGNVVDRGSALMCSSLELLAQQNNTPYPAQNDPDLDRIAACIEGRVSNAGQSWSFDVDHDICNYTRGEETCSQCSHSVDSCHYGGSLGSAGSLAIDFAGSPGAGSEGTVGPQILQAAIACSQQLGIPLKRSTCENDRGEAVACADPSANHTHTSISKCDKDNGPINQQ